MGSNSGDIGTEGRDAYYAPNPDVYGKRHGIETGRWRIMPPCTLPDGRRIEGRARLVQHGALEKPKRAERDGKPWEFDAWRVVLRSGGGEWNETREQLPPVVRYYATDYRTGTGHRVETRRDFGTVRRVSVPNAPEVWEVLNSLCSDASLGQGNTFEDFCSEMGGDVDSISDRDAYFACVETAARLSRFLGVPADRLGELGQTLDEQACARSRAERKAAEPAPKPEGGAS